MRCAARLRYQFYVVKNFANSTSVLELPSTLFVNEWLAPASDTKLRRVLLAPYGDWPNVQGLQRFQKEDAENIINEFNNALKRAINPKSWLGLSWFIGHPDHPDFTGRYTDTRSYGRIKGLEAGNEGLYGLVKFSEEGEKLIADEAFMGHSVNWFLREDPNSKGAWRPFKLKSVGFTNEPNIPVPAVTTANEIARTNERYARMATLRMVNSMVEGSAAEEASESPAEEAVEKLKQHAIAKSNEAYSASSRATESNNPAHHHEAAAAHLVAKEANEKARDAIGDCPVRDAAAGNHEHLADFHARMAKAGANEMITEGEADLPMANRMNHMARMRKIRSAMSPEAVNSAEYANIFGPWHNFGACLTHMKTSGGYSDEAAHRVCGKLQSELEK